MKILIVGSSGMLGSHLFKSYSEKKYEVFGISRTNNNPDLKNNFYQLDFTRSSYKKDLNNLKSLINPEYILTHLVLRHSRLVKRILNLLIS